MSKHPTPYQPRRFEAGNLADRRAEVHFYLGRFLTRQMLQAYHWSGGDLIAVVIFGEIGLHNASDVFKPGNRGDVSGRANALLAPNRNPADLPACNVHSLSRSLRIPRETVRRKTEILISRGWIEKDARGCLRITDVGLRDFEAHHSMELLDWFYEAADALDPILRGNSPATPVPEKLPVQPSTAGKRARSSPAPKAARSAKRSARG